MTRCVFHVHAEEGVLFCVLFAIPITTKKHYCEPFKYLFTTQSRLLTTFIKGFENIVEKEENTGNQNFLCFPQCFFNLPNTNLNFSVTFILSFASSFNSDQSIKNSLFGKGIQSSCPTTDFLKKIRPDRKMSRRADSFCRYINIIAHNFT